MRGTLMVTCPRRTALAPARSPLAQSLSRGGNQVEEAPDTASLRVPGGPGGAGDPGRSGVSRHVSLQDRPTRPTRSSRIHRPPGDAGSRGSCRCYRPSRPARSSRPTRCDGPRRSDRSRRPRAEQLGCSSEKPGPGPVSHGRVLHGLGLGHGQRRWLQPDHAEQQQREPES